MSRTFSGVSALVCAITLAGCGAAAGGSSPVQVSTHPDAADGASGHAPQAARGSRAGGTSSADAGDAGGHHITGTRQHGTATTPTAVTTSVQQTATAALTSFTQRTPATILASSVRALAQASSFRASGVETQGGERTVIRITFQAPSRVAARVIDGGARAEIITTPSAVYINANAEYAKEHFGGLAGDELANLIDRWLELTADSGSQLSAPLLQFTGPHLSACLARGFGASSLSGTAIEDGNPVVQLTAGGGAGTVQLTISALEPHFPLQLTRVRAVSTAAVEAVDPCRRSAGQVSDLRFSDWDQAAVTVPANPIVVP